MPVYAQWLSGSITDASILEIHADQWLQGGSAVVGISGPIGCRGLAGGRVHGVNGEFDERRGQSHTGE